jgi:hypothetical protein
MTWAEIKQAVERAGVTDDDDIIAIECEPRDGAKTLQRVHHGSYVKLIEQIGAEHLKAESRRD